MRMVCVVAGESRILPHILARSRCVVSSRSRGSQAADGVVGALYLHGEQRTFEKCLRL
jgi:hypothetical protein